MGRTPKVPGIAGINGQFIDYGRIRVFFRVVDCLLGATSDPIDGPHLWLYTPLSCLSGFVKMSHIVIF